MKALSLKVTRTGGELKGGRTCVLISESEQVKEETTTREVEEKKTADTARHHRVMYRSCPAPRKIPRPIKETGIRYKIGGRRERHTHSHTGTHTRGGNRRRKSMDGRQNERINEEHADESIGSYRPRPAAALLELLGTSCGTLPGTF
jgi:hypothetical protein